MHISHPYTAVTCLADLHSSHSKISTLHWLNQVAPAWHCMSLEILPGGATMFPSGSPHYVLPLCVDMTSWVLNIKRKAWVKNNSCSYTIICIWSSCFIMEYGRRHALLVPAGLVFVAHISCMTCRPRQRPPVFSSHRHSSLQSSQSCLLHIVML